MVSTSKLLFVKALMMYFMARGRARQQELELQMSTCASQAKRRRKVAALRFAAMFVFKATRSAKKRAKRVRRCIVRAREKWKGSTMYGYTCRPDDNDDQCYRDNFRMDKATFASVAKDIESKSLAAALFSGLAASRKGAPCVLSGSSLALASTCSRPAAV
jgi:hypothetical protein